MKKQILVVEYDLPTIESIKEILMNPIFEITVADEGDTAKKILGNKSFDLMISAAMLPKFHGFNLSQYVASSFPETKIIIISGVYRGLDYKHQATTQYKADDFFEKPLDGPKLKGRVMELLDLEEKDLKVDTGKSTTRIPAVDTAKIPTIKKLQEDEKNLTSEDLFGDIIQKAEKTEEQPSENLEKRDGVSGKDESISREPPSPSLTDELDQMIKGKAAPKKGKDYKNLDDEISKKFEETLSGLGLSSKKKEEKKPEKEEVVAEKEPEPVVAEPKKEPPKGVDKDEEEIGGYDILGLIARGGMAEIYKAKKKGVKGFEKIIAIKKILSGYGEDDRYIEMFVDEAKIAAELTHPNIVQIHDLGKKDDYYFIAMEYVQGKDLREILRKLRELGRPFPEELAIQLIINILTALNFAHTAKDKDGKNLDIVHRDISPPNILVSYTGDIKLTDFGVSKAANKIHQTIAGALKGKLLYMSPEQARGESDIDFRSDIYSVGVILFELITGEKLFLDSSEMIVLKKVQEGNVTKPTKINKSINTDLEEIILKALTSDKTNRYQNAPAFIKDLESYIHNNFNRMPDQNHIAHFLCDLFKSEIKKESIKIDLKSLSQEVKRVTPKKADAKEEKEAKPTIEQPKQIPEPVVEPEFVPTKIELESQDDGKIRDKIDPVPIEIELDEVESKSPKKEVPPPPRPILSTKSGTPGVRSDILTFEKETKKKKTGLIIAIVVVAAIVAGIYFIFLNKSSTGTTNPTKIGQNAGQVQQSAADKKPAATPTETDQKTDESLASAPEKAPEEKKEATTKSQPESKLKQEPKKPETQSPVKTTPTRSETKTQPARTKTKSPVSKPKETAVKKPAVQKEKPKPEKVEAKKEEAAQTETAKENTTEEKKEEQTTPITSDVKPAKAEEKPAAPPTPKVPAVKEGQTFALNMVDTQPIQISAPAPSIPKSALRGRTGSSTILAMVLIDHFGNVESVKLIRKAARKRTNSIVIKAIMKWKYKPATKNNVKVKVWKSIKFTLKPNK